MRLSFKFDKTYVFRYAPNMSMVVNKFIPNTLAVTKVFINKHAKDNKYVHKALNMLRNIGLLRVINKFIPKNAKGHE